MRSISVCPQYRRRLGGIVAVDTSREAPQDLFAAGEEPLCEDPHTYRLSPRSSAIFWLDERTVKGQQTALTQAK